MRLFLPLFLLALAGCAGTPDAARLEAVVVVVQEDQARTERDGPVLRLLLGEDSRTAGELMRDAVVDELAKSARAAFSAPPGAAFGDTLDRLRSEGGADGLLWIRMGPWTLDSVNTSTMVTIEHEFTLYRVADGAVVWSYRVPRRTVALRPGEQRDLAAFVRRVAIEALREAP